jgi:hypothetical protein
MEKLLACPRDSQGLSPGPSATTRTHAFSTMSTCQISGAGLVGAANPERTLAAAAAAYLSPRCLRGSSNTTVLRLKKNSTPLDRGLTQARILRPQTWHF